MSQVRRLFSLALPALLLLAFGTSAICAVPEDTSCSNAPELTPVSANDVQELIRKHKGSPILLNVWATWCQPCREEMPELLRLRDEHKDAGLKLILVSCDFAQESAQATEFLGSLGVTFQTYIKNQVDNEFVSQIDPDWTGALPYSALINSEGEIVRTWEGKLIFAEVDGLLCELK